MKVIPIPVSDEDYAVLQLMSVKGETPVTLAARNLTVSIRDFQRARGMPRRESPLVLGVTSYPLTGRKVSGVRQ